MARRLSCDRSEGVAEHLFRHTVMDMRAHPTSTIWTGLASWAALGAAAALMAGCTSTIRVPTASGIRPATTAGPISSGAAGPGVGPTSPGAVHPVRSVHTDKVVVDDMNLAAGICHVRVQNAAVGAVLPDPTCTPGGLDPAVTQGNLASTICRSGYTSSVRPPATLTGKAKHDSLTAYGLAYTNTTEYDHLVALELGGASSTSNLWPEPNRDGAATFDNPKDSIEKDLNAAVCARLVTLAAAQQAIATDWVGAEASLGLTRKGDQVCAGSGRCVTSH